ncbi:hypothetical protein N656DRAFT_790309 [Canariomyces notabilis]|uniref:N-acetyltransferase domain-containing protein n=1 Tax=Canariomyces notabilis TaxID=2074819 RepID=A0AAN6TC84_9PEZI|nr:hypothetical protein N656DRAFT_790309 [Canariomyces arenarius]
MALAMPPCNCISRPGAEERPRDIETVFMDDVDHLARFVDYPASESGPLFRSMFPRPDIDFSEQQKAEIIEWHADGIKEAITGGRTHLRKIRHSDGIVVGLAGWVLERCPKEQATSNKNKTTTEIAKVGGKQKFKNWTGSLEPLKKERQRAIGHLDIVCRITIMSVCPEYQRQGLGSILMQHICEDMDRLGRHGYVLASPVGVKLYSKFGFEAVGQVDTPYGPITSMLRGRQPRPSLRA